MEEYPGMLSKGGGPSMGRPNIEVLVHMQSQEFGVKSHNSTLAAYTQVNMAVYTGSLCPSNMATYTQVTWQPIPK